MVVEQVCEVGRGLVMEGFVGEKEELEVVLMWDREPVQVLQNRADVFVGAGVGEDMGSRVLNVLKFVENLG